MEFKKEIIILHFIAIFLIAIIEIIALINKIDGQALSIAIATIAYLLPSPLNYFLRKKK